jgi:hypothetical protein
LRSCWTSNIVTLIVASNTFGVLCKAEDIKRNSCLPVGWILKQTELENYKKEQILISQVAMKVKSREAEDEDTRQT